MASLLANGFEGHADGVALTVANSGDYGDTALYALVQKTSSMTFSADQSAHGSRSIKYQSTSSDGTSNGYMVLGRFASGVQTAARGYFLFTGLPSDVFRLMRPLVGNTDGGGFNLTSNGRFAITNTAGSVLTQTASSTCKFDTWYRFEMVYAMHASGGTLKARISLLDDTTAPILDYANTAIALSDSPIEEFDFGKMTTTPTVAPFYMDDIAALDGATDFLGPYSPPPGVSGTLKEPVAVWDGTASTSPSGQALVFTTSPTTGVSQPASGVLVFDATSAGIQFTVTGTDPGTGKTATALVTPDPYAGMVETVILQSNGSWA